MRVTPSNASTSKAAPDAARPVAAAILGAAARLGVWPSAVLASAMLTAALNIASIVAFLTIEEAAWYTERPLNGTLFVIVPMLIGLPLFWAFFVAIERARLADGRAIDNEMRFRNLAEGSVQGICIQRQFEPLYCNRAFAEIFGFESVAAALAYGSMLPLIPESVREQVRTRSATGEREIFRSVVHPAIRRDGSEIWVETTVQRVVWDGEEAVQLIVMDVSERRQVDRLKDEFVSIVSHELRTPLTSIKGALGLVEAGMAGHVSEKAREMIAIAGANSDRLIRLINDILDIERMEAGRVNVRAEALNAGRLARQALEQSIGVAHAEGVILSLIEPEDDAGIIGDRDQLLQVLGNLISNAVKFSPAGGEVLVRTAIRGGSVRFSVTDNGPGIPESFREKVFEKFTQADSSPARRQSGTGLGLSICKLIVEAHRGKIGFDTEPGVATTFYFDLARAPADALAIADLAAE